VSGLPGSTRKGVPPSSGGPVGAGLVETGSVAGDQDPAIQAGRGTGRSLVNAGEALWRVGLSPGDAVRWQPTAGGRWRLGRATRLERDGSIGVTDDRGLARSLPVDRLEVRRSGRRGGQRWESLRTAR
jgi:hypothetical protein